VACGKGKHVDTYQYPKLILESKLEKQYDIAALAMYQFNSTDNCNCFAKNGEETSNVMLLDLEFESMSKNGDTISFWFNFVKKIKGENMLIYTPFSENWSNCQSNGITFKEGSLDPILLHIGEQAIFRLDNNKITAWKRSFNACIDTNNISKNLKYFIEQNK
jgi:hypothetical protein